MRRITAIKEFIRHYAIFLLWSIVFSLALGLTVFGVTFICLNSVETAIQMGLTGAGIGMIICATLGIPAMLFVIILPYF